MEVLRTGADALAPLIGRFASESNDDELVKATKSIAELLQDKGERREPLTKNQLIILQRLDAQAIE